MNDHERRVLARMADEVDRYRAGHLSIGRLLENLWGLADAAEIREPEVRVKFEDLYYRVSSADDARQPWMPRGLASDSDVDEALDALRTWSRTFQEPGER